MQDTKEFTIREYLHQIAPEERTDETALVSRMCELLSGPPDTDSCEGAVEPAQAICDIETDTTYTKSELDWAYQRVHEAPRINA